MLPEAYFQIKRWIPAHFRDQSLLSQCIYCCHCVPRQRKKQQTVRTALQIQRSMSRFYKVGWAFPPCLPKTLTPQWLLTCMLPFGSSVGCLESISVQRETGIVCSKFLEMRERHPLSFPRDGYCFITTHTKCRHGAVFTVRAVAQIGWAVAILLQSFSAAQVNASTLLPCLPLSRLYINSVAPYQGKVKCFGFIYPTERLEKAFVWLKCWQIWCRLWQRCVKSHIKKWIQMKHWDALGGFQCQTDYSLRAQTSAEVDQTSSADFRTAAVPFAKPRICPLVC